MSAGWDARQREWLDALGYEVMAPVAARGSAPVPAPAPPGAHGRAPRTVPEDALTLALVRAARCDGPEALAGLRFDVDALRRDPAAKRALWPVLRTMRRAGR